MQQQQLLGLVLSALLLVEFVETGRGASAQPNVRNSVRRESSGAASASRSASRPSIGPSRKLSFDELKVVTGRSSGRPRPSLMTKPEGVLLLLSSLEHHLNVSDQSDRLFAMQMIHTLIWLRTTRLCSSKLVNHRQNACRWKGKLFRAGWGNLTSEIPHDIIPQQPMRLSECCHHYHCAMAELMRFDCAIGPSNNQKRFVSYE